MTAHLCTARLKNISQHGFTKMKIVSDEFVKILEVQAYEMLDEEDMYLDFAKHLTRSS